MFTVLANEDGVKNFGGSGNVGISEIRFYAIPEPATLSLLAAGSLMIARRRRT